MPKYDFTQLSSHDFEVLTRDLLQAEWNVRLQSFTAGRDQGIDLQFGPPQARTIIQCKHFASSGFPKLLSHVRNCEARKVSKLAPARYVLATSLRLTPSNKDSLTTALAPFVAGPEDILGQDDINNLLGRHPQVEESHFKLWLSSASVLTRVLHNAEIAQTEFEVRRVHSKLRLYVPNAAFPRALELLDRSNIVIISGIPGIGKTTLAELLLYAHLEKGYAPVLIHSNAREGKRRFQQTAKQIFYFDDFLGQTFLGDGHGLLAHNQDTALLKFIEMIQRSNSKLVMTTREHILSNAMQLSERFRQSLILEHRCILQLSDYSFGERAKVLYNHIYFSNLPPEYREQLVADDFFLKILEHRNFNPRQVEWLSEYTRVKGTPSKGYRTFVTGLLDNPVEIWRHSFDRQISQASQSLLLALWSLGAHAHYVMLEPAWQALHAKRAKKYGFKLVAGAFRMALREIEGSFLALKHNVAEFINPSVKDFLNSTVAESIDHAMDLLNSARYFNQLSTLWNLRGTEMGRGLRPLFLENGKTLVEKAATLLSTPVAVEVYREKGGVRGYRNDVSHEERLCVLVQIADSVDSDDAWNLCQVGTQSLVLSWTGGDTPDFDKALDALEWLEDVASQSGSTNDRALAAHLASSVRLELLRALSRGSLESFYRIFDLPKYRGYAAWSPAERVVLQRSFKEYLTSGLDEDRSNCSHADEMHELIDMLETVAADLGKDVRSKIESMRESAVNMEERGKRRSSGRHQQIQPAARLANEDDVNAVKSMFGKLLD